MSRTIFAIVFAGFVFTASSGTSHAAPILPLPAAATAGLDGLMDVQWGATLLARPLGTTALSRWLGSQLLA
jgi:hypothetical protein